MKNKLLTILGTSLLSMSTIVSATPLVYKGTEDGIGKGKHIVFIANDHEYRSEETCPLLAKMLAKHQGFDCTVLFGIDEEGNIKAGDAGIPNLELLKEADLVVFFTRFLNLPDAQVQHIADYLERGGPIIGMRTSTHAFYKQEGTWEKFNYEYKGEDYPGGFGKQIFGSTWHRQKGQSHYGRNHGEGSTLIPLESAKDHPILRGVQPFHAFSGAYKSTPPVGATPLVEVQVLNTFSSSDDINKSKPKVNAGWTRDHYTAPSGMKKDARVVYTSIGASEDFLDANSRRFLINSCLWSIGMEDEIKADLNVDIVGGFKPSAYATNALNRLGVKPADLVGFDSMIMPEDAKFGDLTFKSVRRALAVRPELFKKVQELHPNEEIPGSSNKKKKK